MTYTLKVWYRATPEDAEPQTHRGLDPERAAIGAEAFLRDLIGNEGEGVRRLTVEAER
jgi:hypothetical protein